MTTFEEIDKYIWYYVHDKNDCNFMDADLIYDGSIVWEMAAKIYETGKSAVTFNLFTDWYYRDEEMPQGFNFSKETRTVYYDFIVELLGENWDYIDYKDKGVLFFNTEEFGTNPEKINFDEAFHLELPYYDKLKRWCKATGDGFKNRIKTDLEEKLKKDGIFTVTYGNLFDEEFWTEDYKFRRRNGMEWICDGLLDGKVGFLEDEKQRTITFFNKKENG